MAEATFVHNVKFAFDLMNDELEALLAWAIVLMNRLEPQNPDEPAHGEDVTSWRVAQVLNERLGSLGFTDNMRLLMFGPSTVQPGQ